MKNYVTYILAAVLSPVIASAELPADVTRLVEIRDKEIRKIDDSYIEALERLKDSYTKQGELETAILVTSLIQKVRPSEAEAGAETAAPHPIVGTWAFHSDRGLRNFQFLADGKVRGQAPLHGNAIDGKWSVDAAGKISIEIFNKYTPEAVIDLDALGGARLHLTGGTAKGYLLTRGKKTE